MTLSLRARPVHIDNWVISNIKVFAYMSYKRHDGYAINFFFIWQKEVVEWDTQSSYKSLFIASERLLK